MNQKIFHQRFFAYTNVGTLYFSIKGSVLTYGDVKSCICPYQMTACTRFVPTVYVYIQGEGSASVVVSCCEIYFA